MQKTKKNVDSAKSVVGELGIKNNIGLFIHYGTARTSRLLKMI